MKKGRRGRRPFFWNGMYFHRGVYTNSYSSKASHLQVNKKEYGDVAKFKIYLNRYRK